MKYHLTIESKDGKMIENSDIDMRDSDARKMFVKLKSKYKGTGALMQMLVFRDGKWCGFLKN